MSFKLDHSITGQFRLEVISGGLYSSPLLKIESAMRSDETA